MARAVAGRLAGGHGLTIAAITGSSGKTSTKDLAAQVAERLGATIAPEGSLNNELGVPLTVLRADESTRFLILEMAGGVRHGHKLKAVIPGGSSMPVLPGEIMMETNMDYDSLQKSGSYLGSGAVIVMDDTTCMVRALERLAYFYFEESCGQCTPCREGTGWLYRILSRVERGEGRPGDVRGRAAPG